MADRKQQDERSVMDRSDDERSHAEARRAREAGHTIGAGMTSADSTEAVLSAETGEPDDRALGDGAPRDDRSGRRS